MGLGTLLVNYMPTLVLLDSGATYFFIPFKFSKSFDATVLELKHQKFNIVVPQRFMASVF